MAADAVEVTLRRPPPLDRELTVEPAAAGGVALMDEDELVAEARPAELELDIPAPVAAEVAAAAAPRSQFADGDQHPFPSCFVCGPRRDPGDGLRIFAGPVGEDRYAAVWTPDERLAADGGVMPPEVVWASLDCPTSAPVLNPGGDPPIVLARMSARLHGAVEAGRRHVLTSWPLGADGRKRHAAAAIHSEDGELLGASRALWIELR